MSKEKIAASKMKKIMRTSNDGTVVIFDSMIDASKITGVHYSNISGCCIGTRKFAGGFRWNFFEETGDLDGTQA